MLQERCHYFEIPFKMDTVRTLLNLSYLVPPTFRWTISPLCVGWNAAIIIYMQASSLNRSINQTNSIYTANFYGVMFTNTHGHERRLIPCNPCRPCRGNNFNYRLITNTIEWVVSNNSNNLKSNEIHFPILYYCFLFAQKLQMIAVYCHTEFTATWYSPFRPFHDMFQSDDHHQMQVTPRTPSNVTILYQLLT